MRWSALPCSSPGASSHYGWGTWNSGTFQLHATLSTGHVWARIPCVLSFGRAGSLSVHSLQLKETSRQAKTIVIVNTYFQELLGLLNGVWCSACLSAVGKSSDLRQIFDVRKSVFPFQQDACRSDVFNKREKLQFKSNAVLFFVFV